MSARKTAIYVIIMCMASVITCTAATHYVSLYGTNDADGKYTNWVGAATNIQLAVDASIANDTVLVSNGVYDTGGKVTPSYFSSNRVYVGANITLRSVNGPELTIIKGQEAPIGGCGTGAARCVYLGAGTLMGFTLTNGYTTTNGQFYYDRGGGGVFIASGANVSNCIITGNTCGGGGNGYGAGAVFLDGTGTMNNCILKFNRAIGFGGGVHMAGGTMNNCTIADNYASARAGGVRIDGSNAVIKNCLVVRNVSGGMAGGIELESGCAMYSCTVASNRSVSGGGGIYFGYYAGAGTANNCIIWGNIGVPSSNNDIAVNSGFTAVMNYSCWPTQMNLGQGNIYGDPLFVDTNTANYRLTANSPCVNTGTNQSWMSGALDLDGHSRIDRFSGIVDIGAYEFIYNGSIYRIP